MVCLTGVEALVSLLSDGELDTVALGQGDVGLGALANHEDVGQPGKHKLKDFE